MTGRESIATKAARYVVESRLTILRAGPYRVVATARGSALYTVRFGRRGWRCSCPAMTKTCSHIEGLKLVVSPRRRWWWGR